MLEPRDTLAVIFCKHTNRKSSLVTNNDFYVTKRIKYVINTFAFGRKQKFTCKERFSGDEENQVAFVQGQLGRRDRL